MKGLDKLVFCFQVLLVKDGQALDDENKVCSYGAGTEANPFYMFNMSVLDDSSVPQNTPPKLTQG